MSVTEPNELLQGDTGEAAKSGDGPLDRIAYEAPRFEILDLPVLIRSGGSGVPDVRPTQFPT